MDPIFLLVLAAVVAILGIGVVAGKRRGGADQPDDRGPYSSHVEAAGGMALFGTALDGDGSEAGDGGTDGGPDAGADGGADGGGGGD